MIGRAEDMHRIMDAERDATLAYLDRVTRQMGGRRGQAAKASATGGLIYAHTRHATSRAGDPCPHDHVLLANVVEMKDEKGGWKAADTALWREHLHAATMAGRVAAARVAVELGYAIEADPGPSGRLGHWKIAGVPDEVMELHSKRAAEIEAECQRRGDTSYRARGVAARTTRKAKRHEPEGELVSRWRAELAEAGWPVERLAASVDAACQGRERGRAAQRQKRARALLSEVLGADGDLARRKVFSRRHVVVALGPAPVRPAPRSARALGRPGLGRPRGRAPGRRGRRPRNGALAGLGTGPGGGHRRGPGPPAGPLRRPRRAPQRRSRRPSKRPSKSIGAGLSEEQRAAASGICTSGRGAELVVGVAGAGKTTMLRAVAEAFERAGYEVIGTATSGQAARNLGHEAGIAQSRTLASLIWRLDHGQLALSEKSVVVLDEVGMTDDVHLARLAAYVEAAGAKLVLDRGPPPAAGRSAREGRWLPWWSVTPTPSTTCGRTAASTTRASAKPSRRCATGTSATAVSWYAGQGRVHAVPTRDDALQAAVDAWAADVAAGHETGLYAWRRANVAELNRRARAWMEASGRLSGPELACPGRCQLPGRRPRRHARPRTPSGSLVTSERATVEAVDLAGGSLVPPHRRRAAR